MKKIKFYELIHKNERILLGFCEYKDFTWHCAKVDGHIILTISNDYSLEQKRKILRKVISKVFLELNLFIIIGSFINRFYTVV